MKKQRIPEVSWNAKDGEIYERLSDNEVFADLFNGVVFQGEEIIKPEYLEEMNEKKQLKIPGRDGQPVVIQKLRDVQKACGSDGSLWGTMLAAMGQRTDLLWNAGETYAL